MTVETKRTVRGIIAIALLMLAVGIGVYFATRTRPVPVAPGVPRQPVATAPLPESIPPGAPSANPETPPSPPAETVQPVAEPARHDLTGMWQLSVEDENGVLAAVARVLIVQTGNELTALLKEGGAPIAISLDGMKLRLVLKEGAGGEVQYTFDGVLDPAYIQANGTFEMVSGPPDEEHPEVRNMYAALLVRVTGEMLKKELRDFEKELRDRVLEDKRIQEATAIFAALRQFASRNDGQFPSSLSQLSRGDLPDPSLIASAPGRHITYTGSGQGRMNPEDVKAVEEEFKGKADSRENLIERERRLREVWGSDAPASGSVLHIEYDNPAFTIDVGPSGAITSDKPDLGDATMTPAMIAALRASDANNLKQLMLVIKMFENEHNDFIPGGWLTVYPEYLTDPAILHSPWAPEGTVSYDLLFPGEAETRLEELALQLFDSGAISDPNFNYQDRENPAWSALLKSEIPVVIGRDTLPAEPGQPPARAVAFLDGHVEFVPLADWDTRISPFLR